MDPADLPQVFKRRSECMKQVHMCHKMAKKIHKKAQISYNSDKNIVLTLSPLWKKACLIQICNKWNYFWYFENLRQALIENSRKTNTCSISCSNQLHTDKISCLFFVLHQGLTLLPLCTFGLSFLLSIQDCLSATNQVFW